MICDHGGHFLSFEVNTSVFCLLTSQRLFLMFGDTLFSAGSRSYVNDHLWLWCIERPQQNQALRLVVKAEWQPCGEGYKLCLQQWWGNSTSGLLGCLSSSVWAKTFRYVNVASRSVGVAVEGVECVFSLNLGRVVSHAYGRGQRNAWQVLNCGEGDGMDDSRQL